MRFIMRTAFAALLGASLALTPLPFRAGASPVSASYAAQAVSERAVSRRKAALILGGTVAMVTGLWITLYKRGKK